MEFDSTWAAMLNLDHISGFAEVVTSNKRVYVNARLSTFTVAHITRRRLCQPHLPGGAFLGNSADPSRVKG